jgi:hypothetical protein
MKSHLSIFDLTMWIALIAGKLVLCLCILRKHLFRRLPSFSVYVLTSSMKSLLLFGIAFAGSYTTYYYAFFVTGHIESILAFLTLLECGRQVLPGLDLPRKERAFGLLLAIVAGVVIFAAVWPVHYIENRLEVGAFLVISVTFIFIAIYSRYLGLYWSRLLAGVTATLGMLYLVEGVTRAISWHYASVLVLQVRLISQIANVLAVLSWIIVVLAPWGEYRLTEDELRKYQQVVNEIEDNLRSFAMKGPTE